jgi:hypothetical protein
MSLLRRYFNLLKITMLSFLLSTCIHVGIVGGYYYTFLWLNPDDPGKKKFYSTTSSTGVNIGGKIVGGGGVQTNHHKSYFLHLVREHYKGLSKMFFVQFSAIYTLILFLFKFFPERVKLQEDTMAAFNSEPNEKPKQPSVLSGVKYSRNSLISRPRTTKLISASSLLKRRTSLKQKVKTLENLDEYDEVSTSEGENENMPENNQFDNQFDNNNEEENDKKSL